MPVCSAPVKLFLCIYLIVLVSCSHNMLFSYLMLAGVIGALCLVRRDGLLQVVLPAFTAWILSALILLPAVFLGSPQSLLTISTKVFLSVSMIGILAATTEWNRITSGLRAYHVPGIFIFTLDITLKYIVILGDLCKALLDALTLRDLGHGRENGRALGGILGTAFLKSRAMANDMRDAMICRGFDGTYRGRAGKMFRATDVIYLAAAAAVTVLFAWVETH